MLASSIPDRFNIPFANSAGIGYIRAVPEASQIGITPGAASLTDGFPPLNFLPVSGGGVPPFGQDFNGILNHITKIQQWQNAGGIFKYDAAFSTAIGGYPAGAVLMSTDNHTRWLNLADNNTTDPDGGSPANWISDGGNLVRTSTYILTAGVLQFSINGSAFVNASSTYNPLTVTRFVHIEVQGGGGGGGGCVATGAGQVSAGAGGGAGGYAYKILTTGFSGVTITIGAGGAGGAGVNGTAGTSSSFGAVVTCTGGGGGSVGTASAAAYSFPLGTGLAGTATGGDLNLAGGTGRYSFYYAAGLGSISGDGGASMFGPGAPWAYGPLAGTSATNFGTGGSGAANTDNQTAKTGGNGKSGIIIIREYA